MSVKDNWIMILNQLGSHACTGARMNSVAANRADFKKDAFVFMMILLIWLINRFIAAKI